MIEFGKFWKSYRKNALLVPNNLTQYFLNTNFHGTFLLTKLLFRNSFPEVILRRKSMTRKGRRIEMLYIE